MNTGLPFMSFLKSFKKNKGAGLLELNKALNNNEHLLNNNEQLLNNNEQLLEHPKMKEIMENPLEAIEKNEMLRNLISKQDPSLNYLLDKKENQAQSEYEPSNDLEAINLNEKIKITPLNEKTSIVKVLLLGRSGCGQTTLLGYLTENEGFKGADTMFAQNFEANAFDIKIGEVGFEIKLTESPGMCGGIELEDLGCHWKDLIKTINETGGVGIFMLLIKSNERILYEFFEEFETFSAQYVEDTEMFWKRTIVIFTSIDELKGCNTYEERVERLQTQINGRGMEKLKNIVDQTQGGPLFVSSVKEELRDQFKQNLSNAISKIIETQNTGAHFNDRENEEITALLLEENDSQKMDLINEDQITQSELETIPNEINEQICQSKEIEISQLNSDLNFLEDLNRDQLLGLIKEMCKDENCSSLCKETHKRSLKDDKVNELEPKKKKSKSFFHGLFFGNK